MDSQHRPGVDSAQIARWFATLDIEREKRLRHARERDDFGGELAIWYRDARGRYSSARLAVQPGVADDPPSLLSSVAAEIGWAGVPEHQLNPRACEAVAIWARVWQIREQADFRLLLYWGIDETPHASAEWRSPDGVSTPGEREEKLLDQLNALAVNPLSSESPHGLLVLANRAMHAEDFAAARELYERALADLPRHLAARRNFALALARLGEWEEAVAQMREAQFLAPDDEAIIAELLALETDAGVAAVERGDLDRAAEHFLAILKRQPLEPTALSNLGNLRLRQGQTREALAIFRRFLAAHPAHAAAKTIRLALDEMGEG